MSFYRDFIVQTYQNQGEPSNKRVRAHPLAGQGVPPSLHVECSAAMRDCHVPGTLFKVRCKVIDRKGTKFLYRHYSWPYEVISEAEANESIRDRCEQEMGVAPQYRVERTR